MCIDRSDPLQCLAGAHIIIFINLSYMKYYLSACSLALFNHNIWFFWHRRAIHHWTWIILHDIHRNLLEIVSFNLGVPYQFFRICIEILNSFLLLLLFHPWNIQGKCAWDSVEFFRILFTIHRLLWKILYYCLHFSGFFLHLSIFLFYRLLCVYFPSIWIYE